MEKINSTLMVCIYTLFGIFLVIIPIMFLIDVVQAKTESYWVLLISAIIVVGTSYWNNIEDVLEDLRRRRQ